MSRILTFGISLIFLANLAFAQETKIEHQLKFNFAKPDSIQYPKGIKSGEFYRVVIDSINLNNYRIELFHKDTTYTPKALDFPIFGGIDISDLSFTSLDISSFFIDDEKIEKGVGMMDKKDIEKINDLLKEIDKRLKDGKVFLGSLKDSLVKSNIKIDQEYFDLTKVRIRAKALAQIQSEERIDIDQKLKTFDTLRNNLIDLQKGFESSLKGFNQFFNQPKVIFEIEKEGNVMLKKLKEEVVSAYNDKKKNLTSLQSKVNNENVEKALVSVYQLYQTSTFTSLPIQFNGDKAELTMKFIPKDSISNLQTFVLSPIEFKAPKSDWYWSVGPSLYYSFLEEERVGLETIQVNDSTQNFRVLPEEPLKGEIGVAALLRVGKDSWEWSGLDVGWHFSIGTGVSLGDKVKPRLLYGTGLSFGKDHHLTIDVGFSTGYIDVVSQSISGDANGYDTIYPVKPDVLISKLKTQFFIGVGYVFSL